MATAVQDTIYEGQRCPFDLASGSSLHQGQPATLMHLLWLCKDTNKECPLLAPEDRFEIDHGVNLEFWSQGILQLPRYEIPTGGAAVQAWGNWTYQDEVKVSNIAVFTIGIAATSKDSRLWHYVVALLSLIHI